MEAVTTPTETPTVANQALSLLESIDQSLKTLAEQSSGSITPNLVFNQTVVGETEYPKSEIAVHGSPEEITLPDGRTAPTEAVQALAKYDEEVWPGAVIPEARASVVHAVLKASEIENDIPVLRTNYPFCLDPNPSGIDSPCIKRSGHRGKHQDNNDGTWGLG